jgi:pyridoxal phosphate enzyme (YggS family)
MTQYEKNFDEVLNRIEATRLETNEHQIIKIIAASKYVGANEVEQFYKIGQRSFGENRVQDFKEKASKLEEYPLEWHYIGRIQTNKINALLDLNPFLIHSCESFEMAQEIDKRAKVKNKTANILLQINSANEESKAGCKVEEAVDIYKKIDSSLTNVKLKGVMSIGAHSEDKKLIKDSFEATYKIFEQLKEDGAKYCSMGMSNDFEIAVASGSNMLRLGSCLFQ